MGNRVVVGFQNRKDDPIIYLYQHWGDERKSTIANAVFSACSRWSSPDYATRIVISKLIGNDWDKPLGYGLSVNHFAQPDFDTIFIVRWEEKLVTTNSADDPEKELAVEDLQDFALYAEPATRQESMI